jgi:hypothetical protein
MEDENKSKDIKMKVVRNAEGKIVGAKALSEIPEPFLNTFFLVPVLSSVEEAVEKLNRDMTKATDNLQASIKLLDTSSRESSKKVEKLTIFLSALTCGLLVETGVLIYLTYLLIW